MRCKCAVGKKFFKFTSQGPARPPCWEFSNPVSTESTDRRTQRKQLEDSRRRCPFVIATHDIAHRPESNRSRIATGIGALLSPTVSANLSRALHPPNEFIGRSCMAHILAALTTQWSGPQVCELQPIVTEVMGR